MRVCNKGIFFLINASKKTTHLPALTPFAPLKGKAQRAVCEGRPLQGNEGCGKGF